MDGQHAQFDGDGNLRGFDDRSLGARRNPGGTAILLRYLEVLRICHLLASLQPHLNPGSIDIPAKESVPIDNNAHLRNDLNDTSSSGPTPA